MSCSSAGGLQQAANTITPRPSTSPNIAPSCQQRQECASGSSTTSAPAQTLSPQIFQDWHQPQLRQWQPCSSVGFQQMPQWSLQKTAMDQSHRPHTPFLASHARIHCQCLCLSCPSLPAGATAVASGAGELGRSGKRPKDTIRVSSRNPLEVLGLGCAVTTTIICDRRAILQTGRPFDALQEKVQHLTWCCMCVPAQQST